MHGLRHQQFSTLCMSACSYTVSICTYVCSWAVGLPIYVCIKIIFMHIYIYMAHARMYTHRSCLAYQDNVYTCMYTCIYYTSYFFHTISAKCEPNTVNGKFQFKETTVLVHEAIYDGKIIFCLLSRCLVLPLGPDSDDLCWIIFRGHNDWLKSHLLQGKKGIGCCLSLMKHGLLLQVYPVCNSIQTVLLNRTS